MKPFIDRARVTRDLTTVLHWLKQRPHYKVLTNKDVVRITGSKCGSHLRALYTELSRCFETIRDRPETNKGNRFVWDVRSLHAGRSDYPW